MNAIERKQHTEQILASLGLRIPDELPPLEETSDITLRTPQEVAERIIILSYLNCLATRQDLRENIIMFLHEEGLWDKASAEEKELFQKDQLSEEEVGIIYWRGESLLLLLWTIKKIDHLDVPINFANIEHIVPVLPPFFEDPTDFIRSSTMRDVSEIMDQADLIFRLAWILREAEQTDTLSFEPGITLERFYTIQWVINLRESWDEQKEI